MARGEGETLQARQAADRRERRRIVDAAHGTRVRELRTPDVYRLGDVSRRILTAVGVDLPTQAWQHDRAQALLGARYGEVARVGLVGVLVADGLPTVASVRERLLRWDSPAAARSFDEALAQFRAEAARAREAELDWLAANLRLDRIGDRRELIVELWFSAFDS
jgi:hypothetical protein